MQSSCRQIPASADVGSASAHESSAPVETVSARLEHGLLAPSAPRNSGVLASISILAWAGCAYILRFGDVVAPSIKPAMLLTTFLMAGLQTFGSWRSGGRADSVRYGVSSC